MAAENTDEKRPDSGVGIRRERNTALKFLITIIMVNFIQTLIFVPRAWEVFLLLSNFILLSIAVYMFYRNIRGLRLDSTYLKSRDEPGALWIDGIVSLSILATGLILVVGFLPRLIAPGLTLSLGYILTALSFTSGIELVILFNRYRVASTQADSFTQTQSPTKVNQTNTEAQPNFQHTEISPVDDAAPSPDAGISTKSDADTSINDIPHRVHIVFLATLILLEILVLLASRDQITSLAYILCGTAFVAGAICSILTRWLSISISEKTQTKKPVSETTWIDLIANTTMIFFGVVLAVVFLLRLFRPFSISTINLIFAGAAFVLTAIDVGFSTLRLRVISYEKRNEQSGDGDNGQPLTQQKTKSNRPQWIQQLPIEPVKTLDETKNFELIKGPQDILDRKRNLESKATKQGLQDNETEERHLAKQRLVSDIQCLDKYLLPLFRQRDYDAKLHQTRYRRYQIGYMILAALATLIGSLLALSLNSNRTLALVFGFGETVVALATTYLATISGREAPLQEWLTNRHKAESLRREYFRFLADLAPYHSDKEDTNARNAAERRQLLKMRAASINLLGTPDADEKEIFAAIKSDPKKTWSPDELLDPAI